MALNFEWDRTKADENERKHGVTFAEAGSVFGDPLSLTMPDPRHSRGEERFVTFGRSYQDRLIAVMHTNRGSTVRLISARLMTPRERRSYEEGMD